MQIGNFGWTGQTVSGGSPIGGGGTLNYIAKFTPDGTTIGNSQLYDNGVSVGINTITPDVSAKLDIVSTTQGFLAPRMTTAQRNAIPAPATGLLIYNTTTSFFNYFDGVTWIQIDSSTGGDVSGSGTTNFATMWTDGANSVIGDAPIKFGDTVTKGAPVNTGTDSIAIGYDITMSGTNNYFTGYSLVDDGGNNMFVQGRNFAVTGGSFITDIVVLGFVNTFTITSFTAGIYCIGDSNTFTDFATFSSIIGESNDFTNIDHISSIGIFNIISDTSFTYNFGESNTISTSTSIANFGVGNIIDTTSSFVNVGNSNVVTGATSSVIIGIGNTNIGGFTNNYLIGNGITASATDRIEVGLDDTTKWVFDTTGSASYGAGLAHLTPNGSVALATYLYSYDGTKDVWESPSTIVGAVGWLLDGNTNGALKYIGTNDAFDFPIYTNGVEAGRFLATNQYFGVGTATPTARLHTKGNTSDDTAYSFIAENLAGTPNFRVKNNGHVIVGADTGFNNTFSIVQKAGGDDHIINIYSDGFGKLIFRGTDNGVAGHVTLGNSVIDIDNYSENVAVGVSAGASRVRIKGNSAGQDVLSVNPLGGTGGVHIRDIANEPQLYMQDSTALTTVVISTVGSSYFNGGNVGIGTSSPAEKLTVEGNIAPATTASYTLGTDTLRWTTLYLASVIDYASDLTWVSSASTKMTLTTGGDLGVGVAPTGRTHFFGMTSNINQRLEPVSGVTEDVSGATVNTVDATTTTIQTIAIPNNTVVMIECRFTARKTSGAGVGTSNDGNGYVRIATYANIAGTVTLSGVVQASYTGESIGAFNATLTISGTDVLAQVTGAINDNVTWNVITRVYKV